MLYACAARFDVTENVKNFANFFMNGYIDMRALFSSENILVFGTVALSFLFDKYCPIME